MRTAAIIGLAAALLVSAASAADTPASQERPLYETDPSPLLSTATDAGIRKCAAAIGRTSDHLFRNKQTQENRKHAAWGTWNKDDANGRLYTGNVAQQFSDGSALSVVNASPNASGCDISYTSVFVDRQTCAIVREKSYKELAFIDTMNGDTLVLGNAGEAYRVLLVPQGESRDMCLIAITESMYGVQ